MPTFKARNILMLYSTSLDVDEMRLESRAIIWASKETCSLFDLEDSCKDGRWARKRDK
jgi:hypothetical protein